MVTTQDEQLASQLKLLRSHGMTRDPQQMERSSEGAWYYEQQLLGFNYRLTDIQAALGLSQLRRLGDLQARRELLAARYDELLADLPLLLSPRPTDRRSAWHLYVVEIDQSRTSVSRADVHERMRAAGIGVNVHYIPIHTQPFYARRGFKRGDFPCSERYYERALSIPLYPALTETQQDFVVQQLLQALAAS